MTAKQLFLALSTAKRAGGHLALSAATESFIQSGADFKKVYQAHDAVLYATAENCFSHNDKSVLGWAKRINDHKNAGAYLNDSDF